MTRKDMIESSIDRVGRRMTARSRASGRGGRPFLACIALLLFALSHSVGHASPDTLHHDASPTIVGSWFTTVQPTVIPPFIGLGTFTADGGVINTVSVSLGSPLESPGHGRWVRTGGRTYALTFVTLTADQAGNLLWTSKVRANLTLTANGDASTGVFKVEVFDPSGALIASDTGTVHSIRITVEPL